LLAAVVALLIFILVGLVSGTITMPTQEELILLGSSVVLLIFSYLKSRERISEDEE
jgi:uncharacterized membrane protein